MILIGDFTDQVELVDQFAQLQSDLSGLVIRAFFLQWLFRPGYFVTTDPLLDVEPTRIPRIG